MYYGLIYKVTNIETNKVYIGKTIKTLEERKREHIWSLKRNSRESKTYFYYAIRKYGLNKFIWNVIGYCYTKKELNEAEKLCIDFYQSLNPIYGYNTAQGGDGGITDNRAGKTFKEHYGEERGIEIGNKISFVKKGVPNLYCKGRKQPEEVKRKISEKLMGHTVSEESREKMRNWIRTDALKDKLSAAKTGTPSVQKGKTFEELYGVEKAATIKSKISEKNLGRSLTESQKIKISNSQKGRVITWGAKISQGLIKSNQRKRENKEEEE